MHIWSLENIYIGPIYIFSIFICVFFVQVACCIYANECNSMQMYARLHIIYCSVLIIKNLLSKGNRTLDFYYNDSMIKVLTGQTSCTDLLFFLYCFLQSYSIYFTLNLVPI